MGLGFRPRLSRPVQNGVELYFQTFSSVPSEQGRYWQFLGVCSSYPLSRDGFAVRTRRARLRARGAQDPSICGEDDALRALPPRDCAHQPLPFVKASPKAEFARLVVAEPRRDLPPLAALRVVRVSIVTARDEDMRGERVVVPLHFLDSCIHFAHSVAECVRASCRRLGHICSHEHNPAPKVKHRPLETQPPQMPSTLAPAGGMLASRMGE